MLRKIIFVFGMLSSCAVFATTLKPDVIGLSAGPTWISGNTSQTINLQHDVAKTYTANNNDDAFATAELFFAWQRPLSTHFLAQNILSQLGISIVGAGDATLNGDIWDDADPNFDNYTYSYKVNHAHLAVKGRLIGNSGHFIEPYVSVSLGVGWNRAYDFTINPKITQAVAPPEFNSNTTTAFTYALGIGIQKTLTEKLEAALGYEFSDWGHVNLSRASGQTTGNGLSLNHLYAHQLQLSLFYNA